MTTFQRCVRLLACWLGLAALVVTNAAYAQWKPDHPIRLIVPFAPGAATDISARAISDKVAAILGQPVVIDNQSTASGVVGTAAGARAAADGYTWTLAHDPPFTILPHVRKLAYDPLKDFEPVAMIASIPMVLVVRPGLPVNNVKELIDMARTNPGKLTIASSGIGATSHLAAELFMYESRTQFLHIPFRGQAQGVAAVLGGQVDAIFSSFGPVVEFIRTGKLKALGVSVPNRYASLSAVPTIAESGVPGFDFSVWTGIAVPTGTPKEIRDQINAAVSKALDAPDTRTLFSNLGFVPGDGNPEVFKKKIADDYDKWGKVISAAHFSLE